MGGTFRPRFLVFWRFTSGHLRRGTGRQGGGPRTWPCRCTRGPRPACHALSIMRRSLCHALFSMPRTDTRVASVASSEATVYGVIIFQGFIMLLHAAPTCIPRFPVRGSQVSRSVARNGVSGGSGGARTRAHMRAPRQHAYLGHLGRRQKGRERHLAGARTARRASGRTPARRKSVRQRREKCLGSMQQQRCDRQPDEPPHALHQHKQRCWSRYWSRGPSICC